ncbi:CapA family protein [Aquimarina sp. ERC-38]|uniref:CapA family protein n=1 Tax=Aquimarina sp. ERC-38 TaxID=2949996 RepID=UPI00224631D7|nr:CapA family protein [Aquimarina sp. ERC-38]UZO82429.1 CapA family protein [Aquimarina sp. ERC-38]
MLKKLFLFCQILFLFINVTTYAQLLPEKELDSITELLESYEVKIAAYQTYTVMAVGDIMMGTNFPNVSYLPPPGQHPFKNVMPLLQKANVLFGNLEGTLTDTGENAKNCSDPSKCYSFRSPEAYGTYLQDAGFNVMSIANNHIGDFGDIGIKNTAKTLKKYNIAYAGIFAQESTVFKKDGITYGFCAFAPNKDCLKIQNIKNARRIVRELKEKADVILVSFHGGAEGFEHTHVPRSTERYYGEDRGNVYQFAHELIDEGADLIFGHGPHVSRGFEVYKDRFIAYSLGNFCTYARFNVTGIKGYAPIVAVEIDRSGKFIKGKLYSAKQEDEVYPFMDNTKGALKEIKALSTEDFPENPLVFDEEGNFEPQKGS